MRRREKTVTFRRAGVWTRVVVFVVLALLVTGCVGSARRADTIIVGSKNFTEAIILGEMVAQMLEAHTNLRVERRMNLGGTDVTFRALNNGDLDVYIEYDGTAYTFHLGIDEPVTDPSTIFEDVNLLLRERLGLSFTPHFGFNNTYTLAVPGNVAQQYGLATYSDLAEVADEFVLGVEHEFLNRENDGLPGVVRAYGFEFRNVLAMDMGLKYPAVQQGQVQVINAFTTDGKLFAFNMVALTDDKQFFPPYHAAPLLRVETLTRYPEVGEVLGRLGGQIPHTDMQRLNFLVDEEGKTETEVVREFLRAKGLI